MGTWICCCRIISPSFSFIASRFMQLFIFFSFSRLKVAWRRQESKNVGINQYSSRKSATPASNPEEALALQWEASSGEFQQWFCHAGQKNGFVPFQSQISAFLPSVAKKSWAILSPDPHLCISTAHRTSIYDLRRVISKPDIFLLAPAGTAVRKMHRAWLAKPLSLCSDSSSSLEFII